jgi:fatty acid desaturase
VPAPSDRGWFERRGDTVSWAVTVGHVTLVFAAVPAAAALGPSPAVVLLWLWFGFTMNSLLNLMHECAHRLAFRRRESNDLVGRWVLGPLSLADFDAYRRRHWAHHKNLGLDGDTKDAYLVRLGGGHGLRLLLNCLTLKEAVGRMAHQSLAPAGDEQPVARGAALARTAVVQVVLLAIALGVAVAVHDGRVRILAAVLVSYGVVYLYGLGSLTVLAATLRAVAEHQTGVDDSIEEGRAALRNFRSGALSRLVFGSYGFADHATHHRRPSVPHYRLPEVTAALAAQEPQLQRAAGYVATLRRLRQPPREQGAASLVGGPGSRAGSPVTSPVAPPG